MMTLIKKTLVLLLALFLIYSLSKNILGYRKKITFYESFKEEYKSAQDVSKTLKSDILKSQDAYTVEKNIRNRLNLAKPNEVVVILPKITPTPTPTPQLPKSPAQAWIELFVSK